MRAFFHRHARSELTDILKYYEEISSHKTANEFLWELRNCVNQIADHPEGFTLVTPVLRRANVKRFPYYLLFYLIESQIKVVAVVHNRRHPSAGIGRR